MHISNWMNITSAPSILCVLRILTTPKTPIPHSAPQPTLRQKVNQNRKEKINIFSWKITIPSKQAKKKQKNQSCILHDDT